MPIPKWMKDPKLASDPAWSLARAWYVGEVCGKIMTMADKRGLVKASKSRGPSPRSRRNGHEAALRPLEENARGYLTLKV